MTINIIITTRRCVGNWRHRRWWDPCSYAVTNWQLREYRRVSDEKVMVASSALSSVIRFMLGLEGGGGHGRRHGLPYVGLYIDVKDRSGVMCLCVISVLYQKQEFFFFFLTLLIYSWSGLPKWQHSGKESTCQFRGHKRLRFDPWVQKIPGEGNGNPFQYPCLKKSHGKRRLAGCSPWGHKELNRT